MLRGLAHPHFELALDVLGVACEHARGLVDELRVLGRSDQTDARRRAQTEWMLEAGPRPVVQDRVGAVAERDDSVQRRESRVRPTRARVRPEEPRSTLGADLLLV